jgi:hypothetical protein
VEKYINNFWYLDGLVKSGVIDKDFIIKWKEKEWDPNILKEKFAQEFIQAKDDP